jgi:hypothetical protein
MKQIDPMAEDMFEKARRAFFGPVSIIPTVNASSAESRKPQRPLITEVTGPSPDEHGGNPSPVFHS